MSADEETVVDCYPNARNVYDNDRDTFKVYYWIGETAVALSGSWETKSMAWFDAANSVRNRNAAARKEAIE